ncbi:MAG: hypothetical protein L3K13_09140, partial [Thermoplasmata archaeon]|nr:hypothetical protein [Thermoplasmata archaeon]
AGVPSVESPDFVLTFELDGFAMGTTASLQPTSRILVSVRLASPGATENDGGAVAAGLRAGGS